MLLLLFSSHFLQRSNNSNEERHQSSKLCRDPSHCVKRDSPRFVKKDFPQSVKRDSTTIVSDSMYSGGIISSGTLVTQGEETQGQMRTPSKGRALQAARLSIMLPGASRLGILEGLSVLAVKELECSICNNNMVWKSNDMYLFQEDGFMATYNK